MGQSPLPRVLYLTHRTPFPPDKGDRIRTFHLLRQMAKHGRIWLGCPADEPVSADTHAALNGLCERVAAVPVGRRVRWANAARSLAAGGSLSEGLFASKALTRVLRRWTAEVRFDAVVASSSALVPYLQDAALRAVPKVVDLIDVDSQKWLDFAAASRPPKKWLYRLEAARVRNLERALAGSARAVAVVSRAEAEVYDSFTRVGAATVATNGVDLDFFAPVACEEQPALAFVGALDYRPNEDAAVWFAREVWPAIRARVPHAEFRIIGRNPTPAVRVLASVPGVNLVGPVPDVRPFVASASVAVVPLRLARGVQNKVLEAMAMAKAVIAAPPALAALGAEPGVHLLAASTPQEWVDSVCGLLADPVRRHLLGVAARQYVERHHHWERCLQPLVAAIFPTPVAPA
ncbi:TIGR03087 family PEP-CTERM/XrtA system glycosyltransferase [Frigoriglobus tundricola]|uniref:Glycosyltransferase n=1 Tax=Frigoriglobus tundricola TaxID=2774151 RepID=A0A6M5YJ48_9BACT|nr:TIGR03087 family PEP-CTERM/XrtA system glycosyltransferase [Frigoriglobus tundricola]QJW93360.1 Glycosyltransferase [Frigoriglobus tundricola]